MSLKNLALVDRLKGRENFDEWKFAVENLLVLDGLWKSVEGTETELDKVAQAKAKLVLLVDPSLYVHIKEAKTAKDVWQKLISTFDDSGLTRRVGLLRELTTTKLDRCSSVGEYVNKIIGTAHKLNSIGMKVDDEWVGSLLLSGLPEKFQPMIMAIESSGIKISADAIKMKLLQDIDSYSNSNCTVDMSIQAMPAFKTKKIYKPKGPKCYECGEFGHIKKFCQKYSSKKGNTFAAKGDEKSKFVLHATYAIQENLKKNNWYVDSGATSHMTKDFDLFINYVEFKEEDSVTVADNSKLNILGKGDVILKVSVNNEVFEVCVRDVLHVPNLCANLLSVGQMIENGNQVHFVKDKCFIYNINNKLFAVAFKIEKMYSLCVPSSSNSCCLTVSKNLWHRRLGHTNSKNLENLKSQSTVEFDNKTSGSCVSCLEGKQSRKHFKASTGVTTDILQLIHADVCGPMEKQSLGGARYFVSFLDDFSRKLFVYPIKAKSDVFEKFLIFKKMVENQTDKKIKVFRTDCGTEFCNKNMKRCFQDSGIVHQTTAPYSPQQNGKSERMNRTIVEKARCLLLDAGLEKCFWAEAVNTAAYLINRIPCGIDQKIPEEVWTNVKPDLSHLRVFGCLAMVFVPKPKRLKWDAKSIRCIMVGYCDNSKAYRLYNPKSQDIIISRDVTFLEEKNYSEVNMSTKFTNDISSFSDNQDVVGNLFGNTDHNRNGSDQMMGVDEFDHVMPELTIDINESNVSTSENVSDGTMSETNSVETIVVDSDSDYMPESEIVNEADSLRRTTRISKRTEFNDFVTYLAIKDDYNDPETYDEAMSRNDHSNWKAAIDEEFNSLKVNDTWEIVVLPSGKKPLNSMWVFKTKRDEDGKISRYKARLVAKGCSQRKGVDFEDTYSPVIRYNSLRYLLSLAVKFDLHIEQLDAVSAFLQGELSEEIFIVPPEGMNISHNKVLRLKKSIYGLKQSSRTWNMKLSETLKKFGLKQSNYDPCVYYNNESSGKFLIIAIYVDDILIFSNKKIVSGELKSFLKTHFDMKELGEAKSFLGLNLNHDKKTGTLSIDQQRYISAILDRFGMTECNPVKTPMDMNIKLSKEQCPKSKEETNEMMNIPYQKLIEI